MRGQEETLGLENLGKRPTIHPSWKSVYGQQLTNGVCNAGVQPLLLFELPLHVGSQPYRGQRPLLAQDLCTVEHGPVLSGPPAGPSTPSGCQLQPLTKLQLGVREGSNELGSAASSRRHLRKYSPCRDDHEIVTQERFLCFACWSQVRANFRSQHGCDTELQQAHRVHRWPNLVEYEGENRCCTTTRCKEKQVSSLSGLLHPARAFVQTSQYSRGSLIDMEDDLDSPPAVDEMEEDPQPRATASYSNLVRSLEQHPDSSLHTVLYPPLLPLTSTTCRETGSG